MNEAQRELLHGFLANCRTLKKSRFATVFARLDAGGCGGWGDDEQTYMMEMKSKDEIIKEFLASANVNTLDELDVFWGWLSFMG